MVAVKIAFAVKATTQIKVLNAVKIVGNVANVANLAVVGYKMIVLKDKSPRNKYDLVMGGVAFIPVVGWAASGVYFVGSTIIGDENMNKGIETAENGVTQGWEAVHQYNQSLDATTHVVCFKKGTLVSTPKGFIEIEKINTGENVYSYDLKNDSVEVDTVVNVLNRYTDHIYKIKTGNEIIEVTSEHPFYFVNKGWVKAKELQSGDILKTTDTETKITDISYTQAEIMVYNIEVSKNKNYFVTKSKVLVHNKKILKKEI